MKTAMLIQMLEVLAGLLFVGIAAWRLIILARRSERTKTSDNSPKKPTGFDR